MGERATGHMSLYDYCRLPSEARREFESVCIRATEDDATQLRSMIDRFLYVCLARSNGDVAAVQDDCEHCLAILSRVSSQAYNRYGNAELLLLEYLAQPFPDAHEISLRVDAIARIVNQVRESIHEKTCDLAVDLCLKTIPDSDPDVCIVALNVLLEDVYQRGGKGYRQAIDRFILPICRHLLLGELEVEYRLALGEAAGQPIQQPDEPILELCCRIDDAIVHDLGETREGTVPFQLFLSETHGISDHASSPQENDLDQQMQFVLHIVVDGIEDCYTMLGALHSRMHPIPGCFRDYIAMPKPVEGHLYEALHTTVVGIPLFDECGPILAIIQTRDMVREGLDSRGYLERAMGGQLYPSMLGAGFRSLLGAPFFPRALPNVYLTPVHDQIRTYKDYTPLDFAYHIHTDIGNGYVCAIVNGKRAKPTHRLKPGDVIDVIWEDGRAPKAEWLATVQTRKARRCIRRAVGTSPTESTRPFSRTKVFLSVASEDLQLARPVEDALTEHGCETVVYDRMRPGTRIRDFMQQVRSADFCLLFISDSYLKSRGCMREALDIFSKEDDEELIRERCIFVVLEHSLPLYVDTERTALIQKYLDAWNQVIEGHEKTVQSPLVTNNTRERERERQAEAKEIRDFMSTFIPFVGETWGVSADSPHDIVEELRIRFRERGDANQHGV